MVSLIELEDIKNILSQICDLSRLQLIQDIQNRLNFYETVNHTGVKIVIMQPAVSLTICFGQCTSFTHLILTCLTLDT